MESLELDLSNPTVLGAIIAVLSVSAQVCCLVVTLLRAAR